MQKKAPPEIDALFVAQDWSVPEHKLLIAIIERAARDAWGQSISFMSGAPVSPEAQRTFRNRVRFWLESSEIYPWSYAWMCQYLDMEPKALARRLKEKFSTD